MDEWNTRQHTKSGLVQRVKESEISVNEAEKQTLDFLMKYVDPGLRRCAVIQFAKTEDFFTTTCQSLRSFFHYRHIDVSTLKELAVRWKPDVVSTSFKQSKHLALSDIYDSINELKHYREHFIDA